MLDLFSLDIPLSSAQKCIALNDQMVHSAIHSVPKVKMIQKNRAVQLSKIEYEVPNLIQFIPQTQWSFQVQVID